MIWHLCFVSLSHLFEVRLFSSHHGYSKSYQHAQLSWTDNTHQQLLLESNSTRAYINRCSDNGKHLVATCPSVQSSSAQYYQCRSPGDEPERRRSKRQLNENANRARHVVFILVIATLCFIIGALAGVASTAYVVVRRERSRYATSRCKN